MKFFICFILLNISLVACDNAPTKQVNEQKDPLTEMMEIPATLNDPTKTGKFGKLVLDSDEHDFGNIKEGEIVTHIFSFKNMGDGPLLIHDCQSSCGCTVPNWPKNPILPGESGEIEVKFNSREKPGENAKSVIILTNGKPNKEAIVVRANVISP